MCQDMHCTELDSYFIFINIHWGNFHANVISGGLSSVNKLLEYKSHLEGYYSFQKQRHLKDSHFSKAGALLKPTFIG